MRPTLAFLAPLALALAAAPAAAQGDVCTSSNPCPWYVDVDGDGFVTDNPGTPPEWNWTVGDWVSLNVYNDDEEPHTVALEGYADALLVPAFEERAWVLELDAEGLFELTDEPSGDAGLVRVLGVDAVEFEEGAGSGGDDAGGGSQEGGGIPATALPVAALALVGAAAAWRRTR